jgi:hypothetical protein
MTKARQLADLGNAYDDGALSNRNLIINGAMQVAQRGTSTTVNTGNAFYSVDRFFAAGTNSAGVFTLEQSTETPFGFSNSVKVTVTTSATASGTDNYRFNQAIEGFNSANFGFGSSGAKAITLSFWVRSSLTGTFGGALQNASKNRTYPYTYTITAADTWEYKTITIAGDTSGTWVTDNGIGLLAVWCLGAADRLGPANAWSSTRYDGASGQVQLINTSGATFYITGVQLEVGDTATPYEHKNVGQELLACQRYYEKTGTIYTCDYGGSHSIYTHVFNVVKRAVPTVTLVGFESGTVSGTGTIYSNYIYRPNNQAANAGEAIYDAEL